MKKILVCFAVAALAISVSMLNVSAAFAAEETDWPSKRIEIVWHSKAGSGGDLYLRSLGRFIEKKTGQAVIVNNVTGASGANGWMYVNKAKPDGYTILGVSSTIIASPVINKLPVNYTNFKPVARMFIDAICIYVAGDSKYQTLADLIEDAKARPGEISLGGGTAGNLEFIAAGELMREAGCKASIVPFEGGGDGAISVLGGHIDAGVGEYSEIASSVEGGKMRVLAMFNKIPGFDFPTVADFGYKTTVEKFRGIVVPKETPQVIVDKLAGILNEAMSDPDFKKFYTTNALVPAFCYGDEFEKIMAEQTKQVEESVKNR